MKISSFFVYGVVLGASVLALGQTKTKNKVPERESGILFGHNFSYVVKAPIGWVLDSESGKSQDLSVVFYKRGQSWTQGDAVIYININPRSPKVSLEQEARNDKIDFQKEDSSLDVTPVSPLKTADGRRAFVQTFLHRNGKPPFEESAYVQMPTITQTIVLTAKTRSAFDKAQKDLAAVVSSLEFLSSKVTIDKPRAKK